MRFFLFLPLPLLLVAACGGNTVVGQGSTGPGGALSGGSTTSTVTSTGSGGACPDGGMPIPTEFKTCASSGDCIQQLIYVDCCGSQEAIGVSVSQQQTFQAFEKACNPVVPACECKGDPTIAEDGKPVLPDAPIQVGCNSGLCMTFVP
jgi:hypothetical protein